MRILLTENIHSVARTQLENRGHRVDLLSYAPNEKELEKILPNYEILGIRSKTQLTAGLLKKNPHLIAIGAFCIGTNQISVSTASQLGIPVFNAPHANTRSVAELVLAEMIALSRQLFDRSSKAHRGDWMKSVDGAKEVRGKTLGIIGYGHIGSQLSVLAEAIGLQVVFYDIVKKLPLGNAKMQTELKDLLQVSDFVSLHVPETKLTENMIDEAELATMKSGAFLINASRGRVVNLEALAKFLKKKHIAGCAVDVFPQEPASNSEKFISPLQGLDHVILTPHIGGSTEEAQYAIGVEVSESFRRYLENGSTTGAVDFPQLDLPLSATATRLLNIHKNEPGVLGELNGVISKAGANIQGQGLATQSDVGYLISDIETDQIEKLSREVQKLSRSIKTRFINANPR